MLYCSRVTTHHDGYRGKQALSAVCQPVLEPIRKFCSLGPRARFYAHKGLGYYFTDRFLAIEEPLAAWARVGGGRFSTVIELNFPNAVRHPDDFYDRENALRRAQDVFMSGAHRPVVILGERRVGKSSLQNRLTFWLAESSQPGYLPLPIVSGGIFSLQALAQETLYRLCSALGKELADAGLTDADGRFHMETPGQFEQAVTKVLSPDDARIPVLCIDEFDNVLHACSELERAKILGLVQHLAERAKLRLALLITMTRRPSSPLVSKAETVMLHPFSFEATVDMVEGLLAGRLTLSESAQSFLFLQSGGHPYFSKLLLANLPHLRRPDRAEKVVSQAALEEAVAAASLDPRAEYALENIYRVQFDDDEKKLVLLLAGRGEKGSITSSQLDHRGTAWKRAAKSLHRRDYLSFQEDGYRFRIAFLGHWLRSWVEFEREQEKHQVLVPAPAPAPTVPLTRTAVRQQGVFVDEIGGRVYLDGVELDGISDQIYRALYILYARRDQVVDKEQFAAYVWDTEHYVGDDQRIYQLIRRVRKVLGERAKDPMYLETLAGRGFRLRSTPLRKKS